MLEESVCTCPFCLEAKASSMIGRSEVNPRRPALEDLGDLRQHLNEADRERDPPSANEVGDWDDDESIRWDRTED